MPNKNNHQELEYAREKVKRCLKYGDNYLDLSNCGITDLNDLPELWLCVGLKELHLGRHYWFDKERSYHKYLGHKGKKNHFTSLPKAITKLKNLEILDLNGLGLTDIHVLSALEGLHTLLLADNELDDIHPLTDLKKLKVLDLANNQLEWVVPLSSLQQLIYLDLSRNKLHAFETLVYLKRLQYLKLNNNQLTKVCEFVSRTKEHDLGQLSNLRQLELANNQIVDVQKLGQLTRLELLNLSNNQIKHIPESLCELALQPHFESSARLGLALADNPIESPSIKILIKGRQAVLDWHHIQSRPFNDVKIVLVGPENSGKTSLLKCLNGETFDPETEVSTGAEICTIDFEHSPSFEQQITLHGYLGHFWDLSGQETFNAQYRMFMSKRAVYLLVLNAEDESRFADDLAYWLNKIETFASNSDIVVVVNKIDSNESFDLAKYQLEVTENKQIKAMITASSKLEDGLLAVKEQLAQLVPKVELFNSPISSRWGKVKDELLQRFEAHPFISADEFKFLCQRHDVNTEQQQQQAAQFVNDLGVALFFDSYNSDAFCLSDPLWLTENINRITRQAAQGEGIVSVETFSDEIIELLFTLRLGYVTAQGDQLVMPALLVDAIPVEVARDIRQAENFIEVVYYYDFLADCLLPQISVTLSRLIAHQWRTGVVLESNGCVALIEQHGQQITLRVVGQSDKRRGLLAVIRLVVETVNKSAGMQATMLLPLLGSELFVDYNKVVQWHNRGEKYYSLHRPELHRFEVASLLQSVEDPDGPENLPLKVHLLLLGQTDKTELIELATPALEERIAALTQAQIKLISYDVMSCFNNRIKAMEMTMGATVSKRINAVLKDKDLTTQISQALLLLGQFEIQVEPEYGLRNWLEKMLQNYRLEIFAYMLSVE